MRVLSESRLDEAEAALRMERLLRTPDARTSPGIGAALMRHAIAEAARLGHAAILLVGDPEYYARFGFSAAKTAGLAMPGPFEPRRLLALELIEGTLDGVAGVVAPTGCFMLEASSQMGLAA